MPDQKPYETKRAQFRHKGYKEKATGTMWEFFGADEPSPLENYELIWDNNVDELTTVTSNLPSKS